MRRGQNLEGSSTKKERSLLPIFQEKYLTINLPRLCGSVLDQEQPTTRSALVSKIWGLLETKAVPITVNHYNALLRVHLENGHQFAPEEVLVDQIAIIEPLIIC